MIDNMQLEEGHELMLDFTKLHKVSAGGEDALPVVVQHAETGEVLMLAYVNREALDRSINEGVAVFWSTSRRVVWVKGTTSGDILRLVEVRVNCEQNSLLYRVLPQGKGACHTEDANGQKRMTCYYRRVVDGRLDPVEGAYLRMPERGVGTKR